MNKEININNKQIDSKTMKIFELRPIENLKDGDNPWEP